MLLLVLLTTVILGYSWLTDSRRVRAMAGAYLSELMGGDVRIGKASLSIFEGLRLDNVTLRVDDGDRPDSTIFHAQSFLIRYNPAELISGRLTATQIVAIEPTVTLVEDPVARSWNYQRMHHVGGPSRKPSSDASGVLSLPQIILRDAQVAYVQIRDGKTFAVGWYNLEGQFTPAGNQADGYDFELQSRGRESLGPSVSGSINLRDGQYTFRLSNFTFGPDVRAMLLAKPRQWCESHDLKGRVNIPEMVYNPGKDGEKPSIRAELVVSDVEMSVHPQEWMSNEQNQRVQWFHDLLNTAEARNWARPRLINTLRRLSTPEPIHLHQVSGIFAFTENQVELKGINGKLENNWFKIDGHIDGYSPDAPGAITLATLDGHDLDIPPVSPSYLGSLPPEIQDVYERLRPQGTCGVLVQVERPEPGGRPRISGTVDIHDGQFCFSDFPYPLTHTTGRIIIGPDSFTRLDGIRIQNVKGFGLPNGPNARSMVQVDGFVGPLDQVAGVSIDIRGRNISNEPAIRAAFEPPVQHVMGLFDPEGKGDLPAFHGDFICHVERGIGPRKPCLVNIDVNMDRSAVTLQAFPYPLRDISGRMEIHDGSLKLNARMRKADATLSIDGNVTWKTSVWPDLTGPFGPDLKIVARNMPIDDDLRGALPESARNWLRTTGVSGLLNVDGRVFTAPTPSSASMDGMGLNLDYTFDIAMHDGAMLPVDGVPALVGLSARMKLTPQRLILTDASAHRGDSQVKAAGSIELAGSSPRVALSATASDLLLDRALYRLLPEQARAGWDSIKPQGTVDAALTFQSQGPMEVRIEPRNLVVTPDPFPYRLDKVQGLVLITPDKVTLVDMRAVHGKTPVSFSGQGNLGDHPRWELKLAARSMTVDGDLLKAVPSSLNQVLNSLNVRGNVDLEFSRLSYRPSGAAPTTRKSKPSERTIAPQEDNADVDFAAKIGFQGASMDIGIPASDVTGSLDLAGLVRAGNLYRLLGHLTASKLVLANRPASDFSAILAKSSDDPMIQISKVEGKLAGGDLAGDGRFSYLDAGPGTYELSLVLRDADVRQLTLPADKTIKGSLTASLELGGAWNNPAVRRGHGDVHVFGGDMYNIPVVLGLLQITNLALPLSSPFSEATTRYTIDGQKVALDRIDLKSHDMTMSGNGTLDFATKSVSLSLATDNPTLISLPILGPLIGGVKKEFLKIHVNGTIQQPKISASSFDTITTTVDQVLKGG